MVYSKILTGAEASQLTVARRAGRRSGLGGGGKRLAQHRTAPDGGVLQGRVVTRA